MENRSHALAAGIFTIIFGIAAAIAIWWLGQSDESTTTYLLETRGNVTGLNVQAQVRYRGIRAGKVAAIEPDDCRSPRDPGAHQRRQPLQADQGQHCPARLPGRHRARLRADRG
jgi:hypothetical protein